MEEFLKEEWTKYLISDYCVNKAFLKPPFELKPPDKVYNINGTEFREYTNDRADNELVHYTVREEELTDSDRERENKKLAEITDKPNADFSITKVVNGVVVNSEAFISDYSWNTVLDLGDHYRCDACNTVLQKEEVNGHIKSEGHRNALEKFPPMDEHKMSVVRKIRTHYHCSICNVIVTVKLNKHLESTNHLQFYIFAFNKASQLSVKPKSIDNNAPGNNHGPAHYQLPPVFHNGLVHQHNQATNNSPPYFNNLMPHMLNYQPHARFNNINGFNYYNPMLPNAPNNIRPSMNNPGPFYNNIRPVVNNGVVYNNRPVAPGMWPGPNVYGYVNNGLVYNAPVNTGPINVPDKNNGIIGNIVPVNNTPVNNSVPDNGIVSNDKNNGMVDSVNKSVDETVPKNVMSYASAAKKPVEPDYVLHVNDRNVVKVKFNSWHMIINGKNKSFYCMACKDMSIVNKLEHCNSAEHMSRVQRCPIVNAFEDYFIRKVDDKFYHCGHCNNLKYRSDITEHICRSHSNSNKTTDNVKVGKSEPQKLTEKSKKKAKTVPVTKDATSVTAKGTTLINDKGNATPNNDKGNATSVNHKVIATPIDKTNAVSSNVKGNATPVDVKANATTDAIRTTDSPGANKNATREAESPEVVKVTAEPVKYNFFRKATNVFTSEIKICPFDMELKINLLSYNTVFSHADNLVCGLCDSLVSKEDPVHHICGTVHTEILRCTPFIYDFNNNLIREIRDRLHCAICNVFVTQDNIFNHIMNPPHTSQFTKAMRSDKPRSQASPGPGACRPPTPAPNVPMQGPNMGPGHMPSSNMPCPGNMACPGNMPSHMFGWWPPVPGMPLPNPMLPVTPFPAQVTYPVWPCMFPPRCPVPPLIMPVQNPVQTHIGQHPVPAKTPDGTEDSLKHLKKAESPGTNVHAPEFTPPSRKLIEALKVNESNKTNESPKTSDSHKTSDTHKTTNSHNSSDSKKSNDSNITSDSHKTADSHKTTDSHETEYFEETKVNTKKIDSNVIKEIAKVKEKAARSSSCVKLDIIEKETIPKLKGAARKLDMNAVKSDPTICDIIVKREVLDEVSREVSKIISEEKEKNAKKASEAKKEMFLSDETQDDGEVAKLLSEINKINLDTNFFEETNAGGLSPPNDPKPIAKETFAVIESIWGDSLMSPSISEKPSSKFTFADIEKGARKDDIILDADKCFFKLNDQLSLEDKLLPPPSLDKEKVTIDMKISEENIELASKNTIFTPNNGLVAKIPSLDQNKAMQFDANSIGLTPNAPDNSLITTKPIDKKKVILTYDENAPIKIIRTGTPENLSVENKSFDDNKIWWDIHETTTAKATISKPGHNGVIARKSKLERRKMVEHKEKSPKPVLSVAGVENVVPNETVLDKKEIIFEPLNTATKKVATIAFDPTISKPEKKTISWEEDKKIYKEVVSANNFKAEEPPLESVKTSRVSPEESPNIPNVVLENSKTNSQLKDDETSGKNNIKSNGNKKTSKKTTSSTKDNSIDITETKVEAKITDDKIKTPKEVETTPLETIDDDISSVNESTSDVNEITLDLNEPYDPEEYIYLKLRDVMFKISFSAYNSLVPVGDGNRCCFVCWEQVMYQDLKHHIASSKHEENMRSSKFMYHYKMNLVRWNNSAYHCGVCNVIVTCGMQKHLAWQYHNFQMEEIKRSPRQLARDLKKGEIKQIRPLMTKKVYICTNPPKMTTIPCENIF